MALVEAPSATSAAPARPAGIGLAAALAAHPALWLLVLFLLLLPAFASGFVLVEIFGFALILGMIALSLMFLAGYGGMVSLVQMSVAGCAGYMVAIFGTSAVSEISLGWPWWLAVLVAILIAVAVRDAQRRARGAHRGHLHDHDHARDRVGVLLFRAPELHDLQRLQRLQRGAHAGRRSASSGARRSRSTISRCSGPRSPISR